MMCPAAWALIRILSEESTVYFGPCKDEIKERTIVHHQMWIPAGQSSAVVLNCSPDLDSSSLDVMRKHTPWERLAPVVQGGQQC